MLSDRCLAVDNPNPSPPLDPPVSTLLQIYLPLPSGMTPLALEGQWPLLRATALEDLGQGGFFTLVHTVVDSTPQVTALRRCIDGTALHTALRRHATAWEAAWVCVRSDVASAAAALLAAGCTHPSVQTEERGYVQATVIGGAVNNAPLRCTRTWVAPAAVVAGDTTATATALSSAQRVLAALSVVLACEAENLLREKCGTRTAALVR